MTLSSTIPEPQPFDSLLSLKGRCAVVTGGSRGLGEAIVRRLAEAGASVVLPNPVKFRLPASQMPWQADFLLDARVENNNQATKDADIIYNPTFGTGESWDALHRVTGW